MIGKDEIAEAIRNADTIVEETNDLPAYWAACGVDILGLMYAAEQRALRVIMIEKGMSLNLRRRTPIMLTSEEARRQNKYAAVWMDGFAVRDNLKEVDGKLQPTPKYEPLAASIARGLIGEGILVSLSKGCPTGAGIRAWRMLKEMDSDDFDTVLSYLIDGLESMGYLLCKKQQSEDNNNDNDTIKEDK